MTKLIKLLFRLLSYEKQTLLLHELLAGVFPGKRLYKARPSGYKRSNRVENSA
jgi:hypothetical protein